MIKLSNSGFGFIEVEESNISFNHFDLHEKSFTDSVKEVIVTEFSDYVETKYVLENGAANMEAVTILKYSSDVEVFRTYEKAGNGVAIFDAFEIA